MKRLSQVYTNTLVEVLILEGRGSSKDGKKFTEHLVLNYFNHPEKNIFKDEGIDAQRHQVIWLRSRRGRVKAKRAQI